MLVAQANRRAGDREGWQAIRLFHSLAAKADGREKGKRGDPTVSGATPDDRFGCRPWMMRRHRFRHSSGC